MFRLFRLLTLSAVVASIAVAADIAIADNGALRISRGDHLLLTPEVPHVYTLGVVLPDGVEDPGYHWKVTGKSAFDAATATVTVVQQWGEWQVRWTLVEGGVEATMTLVNRSEYPLTGLTFWLSGAASFPSVPKGYAWSQGWAVMEGNGKTPAAAIADFGTGALVACLPGNPPDAAIGFGHQHRLTISLARLAPGETRELRFAIRLGDGSDTANPLDLADDIYRDFDVKHPMTRQPWPDRRPIAALHPSSSHIGLRTADNPRNPRGWTFGNDAQPVDITTDEGRARFREQALAWAAHSVKVCQGMGAQGGIVWSLEGQEFPHAISYLGSPDRLAEVAPEMDAVADDFFKVFTDAGLRVGVCIRPQLLVNVPTPDAKYPFQLDQRDLWTPEREPDNAAIVALLARKIRYAKERWGVTIYYVDSNVASEYVKDEATGKWKNTRWEILSPKIFAELAEQFPDCLILPEHETFLYWACSVPIGTTPATVQRVWPTAFSVNLMQNVNDDQPETVAAYVPLVRQGDILLFAGWYEAPLNRLVKTVYEQAKAAP